MILEKGSLVFNVIDVADTKDRNKGLEYKHISGGVSIAMVLKEVKALNKLE